MPAACDKHDFCIEMVCLSSQTLVTEEMGGTEKINSRLLPPTVSEGHVIK